MTKVRKRGLLCSIVSIVAFVLVACAPIHHVLGKGEKFTYVIDEAIRPTQVELPGLDGGPPRSVGVLVGPDGRRDEFVVDEVVFRPRSDEELNVFLTKYGGTVLRDGTPLLMSEVAADNPSPVSSGWYLIRIDLQRSSLSDLAVNMQQLGSRGFHLFSSEKAARIGAALAREGVEGLQLGPNFLMLPIAVEEHSDGTGGFLDAETWNWMTEDNDPNTPGDQGLSIGVIHAWRYLGYKGVPPTSGLWSPPVVAIIDSGFDLDASGNPISANSDFFPSKPLQIDLVDHDFTAGGMNTVSCGGSPCPWHGQEVFGVATAVHSNRFGGAGTGSHVAWPLLIRVDFSLYSVVDAIRSAALNGADVINLSLGGKCNHWWHCSAAPDDIETSLRNAVLFAVTGGTIVVAAAGNDGIDLGTDEVLPCEISQVICVGAIDQNANNAFNWGSSVDIWGPNGIYSTVTPPRVGLNGPNAVCCFSGTSAASPFVAGIITLMKALDPSLFWSEVRDILVDTANNSPDAKVDKGYVDAYRAVQSTSANQVPTIEINIPSDGASISHNRAVYLHADVNDPEAGSEFRGEVIFTSNRDGELCRTSGFVTGCAGPELTLGSHGISATATDSFGGTATDAIAVNSINQNPIARITFPAGGETFFADQTINLRGYGFDWDEVILAPNITWSSSADGPLGAGKNILVSLNLGTHTVTLTATDSLGLSGQDTILLNVQMASGHPTALIVNPEHNSSFLSGTPITFEAQGTDPEDGTLSGGSLTWVSDIDGFLGTGTILTTALSGPSCGIDPHNITLRATDSDGNEATHSIVLQIGRIC